MRDSRPRQTTGTADPGASRDTALQHLGLEPGSPLDDAAAAHDALVAFLATAPRSIHGWAHAQAMSVDAAYASLTETVVPGAARPDALVGGDATATARPGEQDRQPARRVTPPPVAAPTALSEEDRIEELLASVTPSHHRDSVAGAAPAVQATPAPAPVAAAGAPGTISIRVPGRKWLMAAGLVVAIGVVAIVGYGLGGQNGASADTTGQTATAGETTASIDQAKVAELMTRIGANPNDADALLGVGDEYFQTGDYVTAADWFRKAAAADPASVKALLALGAAVFNGGDLDGAEIQWTRAVELDPANVEGHYDLGFLYLNREPADMAGVQREWNEVIRLAPESDIAKTVKTHLDALQSPAPGSSGAPLSSGEPAAVAASIAPVAATPAPVASAAPAASVQP